jgi:hypothetical protein
MFINIAFDLWEYMGTQVPGVVSTFILNSPFKYKSIIWSEAILPGVETGTDLLHPSRLYRIEMGWWQTTSGSRVQTNSVFISIDDKSNWCVF